ncbi:MAG: type 1 glutamine amidotransferase [Acidimicrobiia bacterium]
MSRRVRRALIVQQEASEGPFAVGAALQAAGFELDVRHPYAGDPLPADTGSHDALVILGGPMAAYSDDRFAWRGDELRVVAAAVAAGTPTLGICLGAQILAHACGGRAVRGPQLEIGWLPVRLTGAAGRDSLFTGLPEEWTVLQWHGDTVELPPGAELLASNDRYPHQAFRLGPHAWGVQFHIEVDQLAVPRFCEGSSEQADAAADGGVARILADAPAVLAALAPTRDEFLRRFAARAVETSVVRPV